VQERRRDERGTADERAPVGDDRPSPRTLTHAGQTSPSC
jgi:hypothetical protein